MSRQYSRRRRHSRQQQQQQQQQNKYGGNSLTTAAVPFVLLGAHQYMGRALPAYSGRSSRRFGRSRRSSRRRR